MLIRTAVPADAAALAEVEALCFPAAEAAPEQQFRDRLQAYAGHFWLMFDGETLISFVDGMVTDQPDLTDDLYENAALHSETGAWQMIFGVVTRPEYRKHGLAAQLLNRAIADARKAQMLQTIESELELTQREGEKGARMRGYRRRVSSFSFVLFNLFIFAIQISGEIIKSS